MYDRNRVRFAERWDLLDQQDQNQEVREDDERGEKTRKIASSIGQEDVDVG